ncbi:hypothetical protein C5614_01935 [Massilia phosphatilytica]|nr:hypothetical protein C5614_01935 [Massilia phosphatilytica]
MNKRLTALVALLGTMTMTAHAGVLTLDGVTFASSWSGNVLTLEIDAANRSGGWSGATGLAALAIKGVGTYSSVSVSGGPGGTNAWKLSTSELKASGCSGTSNGAAGSRMCFYGQQIALADDMVFKFTFAGASVATNEPHVKVEFVDAKGNKVGSLLSQVLPASTATPTAPVTPTTPVIPVIPVIPDTPTTSTGTQTSTTADTTTPASTPPQAGTKTPTGTLDVASPSGTPASLPPQEDLPSTLPTSGPDVAHSQAGNAAGSTNVPEPESIALLLGGLGLMGLVLRRRSR